MANERQGTGRRWGALRSSAALALCLGSGLVLSACQGAAEDTSTFTTGNVTPRLQNNEPERLGATINAAAFNAKAVARTVASYSGFVGDLRVNYAGERSTIETDLRDIGQAAPANFDPNETVTVDFQNASLNFILEQLLRGALGLNYVAPPNLPGGLDFRTETPIPKSRVVQVVRDLLARNGLVMRLVNGVFHIGTPDVIEALQRNSAVGQAGDEVSRVVRLGRGNANQVTELAKQLLPENVSVVVSSASDTVVIRASPTDVDSVERLVQTLSQSAVGSDQIAIIPLSRSAPEAVATKLTEFYRTALRQGDPPVTIIPLENQQAILAGTSDATVMAGLQQLAAQIDRSVTDLSALRVIPLTHIHANEIAPQLAQIFGSTVQQNTAEPVEPSQSPVSTGVRARLRPAQSQGLDENDDGTGLAVPGGGTLVPEAAINNNGASQATTRRASGGNADNGGGDTGNGGGQAPFAPSTTAAPAEGETRIVADERNNALLVYSTFTVFKRMQEVVQTLDVAQAQVVIEATVIEVQLNDTLSSGVQFFLQSQGIVVGSGIPINNQSPTAGGVIGVGADIGPVSVDAVLRALRSVTNIKVVSSPYLTVVDGKSARLVIGDQIPFASTTQTSNNTGGTTVTQQIEVLDTGVVLEITPRIHANNSVNLDIVQSVSTPTSQVGASDLTPVIATRDISSQILAQSGRTILLGGLIQDRIEKTEQGVPGAARAPILGALFRQRESRAQRTELLVLITPRVVRSSSEIENITRLLQGVGTAQRGVGRRSNVKP